MPLGCRGYWPLIEIEILAAAAAAADMKPEEPEERWGWYP